jgi:Ca2+-binding EF-hand superfamily protein
VLQRLHALSAAFVSLDPSRCGRLDEGAFAAALKKGVATLSWADVGAAMHSMHLENAKDIDYRDFVDALRALYVGGGGGDTE